MFSLQSEIEARIEHWESHNMHTSLRESFYLYSDNLADSHPRLSSGNDCSASLHSIDVIPMDDHERSSMEC